MVIEKELINRFDITALQDSFNESAMACGCEKEFWRKPKLVEYVRDQNPFDGITIITDKLLHIVPQVQATHKVAILQEPRELLPQIYHNIIQVEDNYDLILTHDNELLSRSEKYVFAPADATIIKNEGCKVHHKSKLISMVYSNKTELFGHRLRHIIAKTMIPQMKLSCEVQFYGSGANKYVRDKLECLKDYRFQIVTENAQRDYYYTDKLLDCFITGTVPIYWGANNIGDFFNSKGILSFNHPNELKKILTSIDEEKYNQMIPYIEENFQKATEYMFLDDIFYKTIRKGLHYEK
jgi:hypothetical protein